MFFNKKLKQTEAKLLTTQYDLKRVQESLITTLADLDNKNQAIKKLTEALHLLEERQQEMEKKYGGILNIDEQVSKQSQQLSELTSRYQISIGTYNELVKEIELYEERLDLGSFGLYAPQFDFDTSEKFKAAVEVNYEKQKALIKEDKAVICYTEWSVGGSKTEGKKMTNQYRKLMLFAFNGECEGLIARVKWNNAVKTRERITKAFEAINKLGASHNIDITKAFLALKLEEMALYYELEQKKYQEKEEQRRIREQMREEEKAQREFERAQKEAEDEETRYRRALEKAQQELSQTNQIDAEILQEKVRMLEQQLEAAHEKKERAIAMAQLTKVGHIYVISNIGSFGENVYKMGMTRRLDPLDRVRELGDASVPFQFDVHAIIYSENAPQLEYELHQQFSNRRLNRINHKKEFFRVTLEEIETFVHQHTGASIEFTKLAEARDYRETIKLVEELSNQEQPAVAEKKFPASIAG
jgi:hypothetical protein